MLGNCSYPFCPKRAGRSPKSEISSQRCSVEVESRFGFSAFLTTGAALVSSKALKKRIPAMFHFTGTRYLPRNRVLLLHLYPGVEGARCIQHQGAGHIRQSRLRAVVSRADEHAGMD